MDSTTDLTPTEDLVLDVLGARARLGERLWTFDARHKRALNSLEQRGLINVMHGIIQKTARASLTEAGRALALSSSYVPPIVTDMEAELAPLRRFALQFARPSGDSPDCTCASCAAWRAVHRDWSGDDVHAQGAR